MKYLSEFKLSAIIVLWVISTGIDAQSNDRQPDFSPEEMAEFQTDMQTERLSLTEDQKSAMHAINLKYAEEMKTIRSEGRSRSTFKKMREMGERKDQEVKQVLDEGQYNDYLQMKEEMRKKIKERRKASDG